MKLLALGVILSLNLNIANALAASRDPSACEHDCAKLSGHATNDEIEYMGKEMSKLAKHDDVRFRLLAKNICGSYMTAGANFKTKFNEIMKRHMGKFENNPNPTPKQITDYLNKHKDKMTCGMGKNKKNYMMMAFDEIAHTALFYKVFMQDYMAKDRSAKIDVNAVSYTGPKGTPETVLDYMDNVLKDTKNDPGFLKEVKRLRRFFVGRLGAKKFKEFSELAQAKYMRGN